jgi:hypothetical protein
MRPFAMLEFACDGPSLGMGGSPQGSWHSDDASLEISHRNAPSKGSAGEEPVPWGFTQLPIRPPASVSRSGQRVRRTLLTGGFGAGLTTNAVRFERLPEMYPEDWAGGLGVSPPLR